MNYNNIVEIPFEKLQENPLEAARQIGEGNAELEALMLFCLENNIRTYQCCSGNHENTEKEHYVPYITFVFEDSFQHYLIDVMNHCFETVDNTFGGVGYSSKGSGRMSLKIGNSNKANASIMFTIILNRLKLMKSDKVSEFDNSITAFLNDLNSRKSNLVRYIDYDKKSQIISACYNDMTLKEHINSSVNSTLWVDDYDNTEYYEYEDIVSFIDSFTAYLNNYTNK